MHKKRVQLPQDRFGTPTWPPIYCFGTPIWPPWRHVKTLYKESRQRLESAVQFRLTRDPKCSTCNLESTQPVPGWVIGACKNCFQYITPVYQLLVYPVIGQFWQFRSTMSTESLRFNVAAATRSTTATSQVHQILWHISLPFLHDYDVKMPNFVFCGERKQATTKFYFSFWIGIGSLGIQFQEGSPIFDNVSG